MRQAFSLVELSIVLVILGLLTGGILAGQNLIRAAELRAVTAESDKIQTAVNAFRNKYLALPGDMTNAAAFWGIAGGTTGSDNSCYLSTTGSGTQTCNGDGNAQLTNKGADAYGEVYMFWQHLANAGLIEGSYTGIAGSGGGGDHDLGVNCPTSKVSNAGWTATVRDTDADTSMYDRGYINILYLGAESATGTMYDNILTPEEMWNIDKKMDDGKPAYGRIMPMQWTGCTDSTSDTDFDKDYDFDSTDVDCTFLIAKPF